MKILIADSGSTKTHWALVEQLPGLPKLIRTTQTQGLNPLYVTTEQIASACRMALVEIGEDPIGLDELRFYGSGCSGDRISQVEHALRTLLTPRTRVVVDSDLMGAAMALEIKGLPATTAQPFIACILGTGSIAALFDPATRNLLPMPALGYVLGDEGSGAWFGRHLLSDYLKKQMPKQTRQAFEDDFGTISAENAIRHVYQMPTPNRYLATFAAFVGRHLEMPYVVRLAYRGVDEFWRRNVLPIGELDDWSDVNDVRLVGSLAWSLRPVIEKVAESHGFVVTQVIKDPIEGLV